MGVMDIRPARMEDVPQIAVVHVRSWQAAYRGLLPQAYLDGLAEAGFGQVILWVLDSNARARRFYEAGGWLADGAAKRDDSFGVPMNEVRYRRSLP
jgi:hypothetical protein